jgi:hypothetical protein
VLPEEWKDFMPEISKWFGVPLMLAKLLYGNQVANLTWDETQEEWLTSDKIGIRRMLSEYSIFFIKYIGKDVFILLNAVDDQLYMKRARKCGSGLKPKYPNDLMLN